MAAFFILCARREAFRGVKRIIERKSTGICKFDS
jgi:hypothetical protein